MADNYDIHKNLYNAVFSSMGDAVVTIDLDGFVTSWNKMASLIYGYGMDEVIGKPLLQFFTDQPLLVLYNNIEKIKGAYGSYTRDSCNLQQENQQRTLQMGFSAIMDETGLIAGICIVSREIPESEKRFKTLTDTVPQIIWENDAEGKAIYFNQRFIEYSGLDEVELYGKGWEAIAHPDGGQAVANWRNSLAEKVTFESEVLLRRADGVYLWHLLRNVPLKDSYGHVTGWFGSATDIDDQKKTEIRLQEMTERMRTTLETATDFAIITMDAGGQITDWNSGAENMFGYPRTEATGQQGDLIFTDEDKYGGIPALEFRQAAADGRSIDERWHIRRDRSRFFMSGVMSPIVQDGNIAGYVKIARDITERKLAEEALLVAQGHGSLSIQFTGMGQWEWNIRENIIYYSDNARYVLGLRPAQPVTEPLFFDSMVIPDDRNRVQQQVVAAVTGLNIFQAECRVERADNGEVKWMNAYGRVVRHDGNTAVTMIGVLYDITERKMLEKDKDDFINIASHELKTPVTSIKAYSDLLAQSLSDDKSAMLAARLSQQVDRLMKLIHQLLDATYVAEGRMQLQPERFDMSQLITGLIDEMLPLAGQHVIHWTPAAIPLINGDKERIGQVVSNFITNALKYSHPDGPVYVTVTDQQDRLMVRVRDNGPGIPVAEQARIFQRYRRVVTKDSSHHAGLGLGLYICSEIIRDHHGTIGVESIAGQGADFYFTLPYL